MKNMKKWNLVIDVAGCENCSNCALATKDEHIGNDFPGYAAPQPRHGHHWIRIENRVRGSAPNAQDCSHPDRWDADDRSTIGISTSSGASAGAAVGLAIDSRALTSQFEQ